MSAKEIAIKILAIFEKIFNYLYIYTADRRPDDIIINEYIYIDVNDISNKNVILKIITGESNFSFKFDYTKFKEFTDSIIKSTNLDIIRIESNDNETIYSEKTSDIIYINFKNFIFNQRVTLRQSELSSALGRLEELDRRQFIN